MTGARRARPGLMKLPGLPSSSSPSQDSSTGLTPVVFSLGLGLGLSLGYSLGLGLSLGQSLGSMELCLGLSSHISLKYFWLKFSQIFSKYSL